MKQIKFVRLAAAAALTAVLLFTGCSDGGSSTPTPRPEPDPNTPVTTSKTDLEDAPDVNGVVWRYAKSGTNTVTLVGYSSAGKVPRGAVRLPGSTDEGYIVTGIGVRALAGSGITSVILPERVETIEAQAFKDCTSLTAVDLQAGRVKEIGAAAFANTGLVQLTIPEGVRSIGAKAFYGCKALETLNILGVPTVDGSEHNGAFEGCTKLRNVKLNENTKRIADSMFAECKSLQSISLPAGLTQIGKAAFSKCTGLKEIALPDSLAKLGENAFAFCESLQTVNVPAQVTVLNARTFWYCTGLTGVTLPDKLTEVGEHAFAECRALESIVLPDSVKTVGKNAFGGCYELKRAVVSSKVSALEDYTFDRCEKLEKLYIPQSVSRIGKYALPMEQTVNIYYGGTETAWSSLVKQAQAGNTALSRAKVTPNALPSQLN